MESVAGKSGTHRESTSTDLGHPCSTVVFIFFRRDSVENIGKPLLSPNHRNLLETQHAPLSFPLPARRLSLYFCLQDAENSL